MTAICTSRKSTPYLSKNATMPANFTQGWFSFTGLNWDVPAGNYWIAVETDDPNASELGMPDGVWTGPVATLAQYIGSNSAWSVYADHSNDRTAFGMRVRVRNGAVQ